MQFKLLKISGNCSLWEDQVFPDQVLASPTQQYIVSCVEEIVIDRALWLQKQKEDFKG